MVTRGKLLGLACRGLLVVALAVPLDRLASSGGNRQAGAHSTALSRAAVSRAEDVFCSPAMLTGTPAPSVTQTPSSTVTGTPTVTDTPTDTGTPTSTIGPSPTWPPTYTPTPTTTSTPTTTNSPTSTSTATATTTPTISPTLTATPVPPTPVAYYFAEGYTGQAATTGKVTFVETLNILNPSCVQAPATITYYFADGSTPRIFTARVPPASLLTVSVNADVGPDRAVSALVTSPDPIYVSRTIVRRLRDGTLLGGSTTPGVTAPGKTWLFAEGYTGMSYQEYLAIFNPSGAAANVTVQAAPQAGAAADAEPRIVTIPAQSRLTFDVRSQFSIAYGRPTGLIVTSDQPVAAERVEYFGDGVGSGKFGSTVAGGVASAASTWTLPYGSSGGATGDQLYLTVVNPGSSDTVQVTVHVGDQNGKAVGTVSPITVPARTRRTLSSSQMLGSSAVVPFATTLSSTGPVVVEGAQYFSGSPNAGSHPGVVVPGWTQATSDSYFSALFTALPDGEAISRTVYLYNPGRAPLLVSATYFPSASLARAPATTASARATAYVAARAIAARQTAVAFTATVAAQQTIVAGAMQTAASGFQQTATAAAATVSAQQSATMAAELNETPILATAYAWTTVVDATMTAVAQETTAAVQTSTSAQVTAAAQLTQGVETSTPTATDATTSTMTPTSSGTDSATPTPSPTATTTSTPPSSPTASGTPTATATSTPSATATPVTVARVYTVPVGSILAVDVNADAGNVQGALGAEFKVMGGNQAQGFMAYSIGSGSHTVFEDSPIPAIQ